MSGFDRQWEMTDDEEFTLQVLSHQDIPEILGDFTKNIL